MERGGAVGRGQALPPFQTAPTVGRGTPPPHISPTLALCPPKLELVLMPLAIVCIIYYLCLWGIVITYVCCCIHLLVNYSLFFNYFSEGTRPIIHSYCIHLTFISQLCHYLYRKLLRLIQKMWTLLQKIQSWKVYLFLNTVDVAVNNGECFYQSELNSNLSYNERFLSICTIRPLSGTSSFSNDTVRFTAVSTHACYNGDFGI